MNTRTGSSMDDLEVRATEALRALLGEVSVIKLKEIRRDFRSAAGSMEGDIGLVADVDVLGHSHTLACEVKAELRPENLTVALRQLRDGALHFDGAATPVLIAPYLSPEAQALCKQSHAAFLDLSGNARIALGEVFIGKRSLPARAAHRSAAAQPRAVEPRATDPFAMRRALTPRGPQSSGTRAASACNA